MMGKAMEDRRVSSDFRAGRLKGFPSQTLEESQQYRGGKAPARRRESSSTTPEHAEWGKLTRMTA